MIKLHTIPVKFLDMLALCAYCGFIYWLSSQSSLKPPIDFGILYQDKLYHAGAYFIMGLLTWRSFRHITPSSITLTFISIVFCSLYGVTDEWHQSFVHGRSSDAKDWIADTFGASLAVFFLSRSFFSANRITLVVK